LWIGAAVFTLAVGLPMAAILVRVATSGEGLAPLTRPIVIEALKLSAITTLLSLGLALVLGTPVAYLLARHQFPGSRLLETLIELPMVLPPSVAGLALLMAFGRRGLLGGPLDALGITIAFTTAAVVVAQFFVAAPFYVRSARSAFGSVDRELETVARTLGVSNWATFWRVTVPVAFPTLLGGAVMCWARALGEFGATIMFAGSLPGRTQTMPLAIYAALESDLDAALTLAAIMILVAVAGLLALRAAAARIPPVA
jgi:molybdate transport system permease protein